MHNVILYLSTIKWLFVKAFRYVNNEHLILLDVRTIKQFGIIYQVQIDMMSYWTPIIIV